MMLHTPVPIPTSEVQNCGVFPHGHRVPGRAGVIPSVLFSQALDDEGRGIDVRLVAVEHPAEVSWRDRVGRAPQRQRPAKRRF